jgi:hypothetical protein
MSPHHRLVVVGGEEKRYTDKPKRVNRADAISRMLTKDRGVHPDQVDWRASPPNTAGNIQAMQEYMREIGLNAADCIVISNSYHLARAGEELAQNSLSECRLWPAEAFSLITGKATKDSLIQRLGGHRVPLAVRCADEIAGMASQFMKRYYDKTMKF